ncbi:glycosyltransferase family 25 protein [Actinobacillus arthritidis]|uniref:glycosyltransferase family 25 protein n=1 Tax=Actinobacillus arthritidis TaxID=157339 RepID=UPI0024431B6A|nr:glycosyltransferase family 25 protein [Actinobacillus arthritidis]WGE88640.1 glycosyltransferase family 25 protein [Actinobacillus arthritidis]
MMISKGYVINLERSKARLETFNKHPDSALFERVDAVDGQVLSKIDGIEKLLFDSSKIHQKYYRAPVKIGEICCTLSHIKCWETAINDITIGDNDFVIIAEDDVLLCENFKTRVNEISLGNEVDLVILQKLGNRQTFYKNRVANDDTSLLSLHILTMYHEYNNDGSALYLIRKSRMRKIISRFKDRKPNFLADEFTEICDGDRIRIIDPLLGYIAEDNISDIHYEG